MTETAAPCRAHCESHYCCLRAGHPGLHQTAASERLSTGRREFGELYYAGWTRDDSLASARARKDARVRELARQRVGQLRTVLHATGPITRS